MKIASLSLIDTPKNQKKVLIQNNINCSGSIPVLMEKIRSFAQQKLQILLQENNLSDFTIADALNYEKNQSFFDCIESVYTSSSCNAITVEFLRDNLEIINSFDVPIQGKINKNKIFKFKLSCAYLSLLNQNRKAHNDPIQELFTFDVFLKIQSFNFLNQLGINNRAETIIVEKQAKENIFSKEEYIGFFDNFASQFNDELVDKIFAVISRNDINNFLKKQNHCVRIAISNEEIFLFRASYEVIKDKSLEEIKDLKKYYLEKLKTIFLDEFNKKDEQCF